MKRKLKTWEQFKSEFRPMADRWVKDERGYISLEYKNMHWCIIIDMQEMFGTEIEVREYDIYHSYTYKDMKYGYIWHELWFEPEYKEIEFITKEEIEI